jgi:hypothetical protein
MSSRSWGRQSGPESRAAREGAELSADCPLSGALSLDRPDQPFVSRLRFDAYCPTSGAMASARLIRIVEAEGRSVVEGVCLVCRGEVYAVEEIAP